MKIKLILQLHLILLSFTSVVYGQTVDNEGTSASKEIIKEKHYRIQLTPIATSDKPIRLVSDAEYTYEAGKLMEQSKTSFSPKELKTREVYGYTDGMLTSKFTYLSSSEKPMHKETFTYDESGEWQNCKTLNHGKMITLERLKNKDGKIEAEGLISNGKLKVYVDRIKGDSSIHLEINYSGTISKQRQDYKMNDYGHVISEKIFVDGDSLILNKETAYSYKNSGNWTKKITDVTFVNYDGLSYTFRDSLVRSFEYRKEKELTKKMLIGNWHFENSNENFISFLNDSIFYTNEGGQTKARGTWSLDSGSKVITIKFNAGDDKGETIKWNYGYADESMFEVHAGGKTKVFIKR